MTLPARDWLPQSAIQDSTVRTLVARCAASWAERWLSDPREISAAAIAVTQPTTIPGAFSLWSNGDHTFSISADDSSISKLGAQILVAPAGGRPNPTDLNLYRQLAEKAVADLAADLGQLFGCGQTISAASDRTIATATRFALSFVNGGPALDLYVANALVVRARRTAAAGARPGAPLSRLSDAIDRQSIKVGAMVGAAQIGLSDLYGLTCGDVIVLDRLHEDGVTLTINGRISPSSLASVQKVETGLELRMKQMEHSAP